MFSGINGNVKGKEDGLTVTEKLEFGSGDDKLNPFDSGLAFGAGLQFGNIQALLGYNVGVSHISRLDVMNNHGLAITMAYLFGK
jgi:hypothetical protein